ncbi:MAG: hypothetical protein IJO13_00360 [Lachnospiraceae bacterium]|nr:hypothetical protein [Lachnospiraceae bacterium]
MLKQVLFISKRDLKYYNDLLTMTGPEIYAKYGLKEDEKYVWGVKFSDSIEADIKLVICRDDKPYTEGVLFENGHEVTCTDCYDRLDTEYEFNFDGKQYIVKFKEE